MEEETEAEVEVISNSVIQLDLELCSEERKCRQEGMIAKKWHEQGKGGHGR
jgi:hypothetical protein